MVESTNTTAPSQNRTSVVVLMRHGERIDEADPKNLTEEEKEAQDWKFHRHDVYLT